jgi:hypothetical protein
MNPRIAFIREPAAVRLIGAPRPLGLLSYDELKFVGWDMARPEREVDCVGVNEAQAQYDAAIKLSVPAWRIRVRRALPPVAELPTSRLA